MAECPVCGAKVDIQQGTELHEIVPCTDCGTELEIVGADAVKEAPQEEEDWGE